jgi:hypothetical protein
MIRERIEAEQTAAVGTKDPTLRRRYLYGAAVMTSLLNDIEERLGRKSEKPARPTREPRSGELRREGAGEGEGCSPVLRTGSHRERDREEEMTKVKLTAEDLMREVSPEIEDDLIGLIAQKIRSFVRRVNFRLLRSPSLVPPTRAPVQRDRPAWTSIRAPMLRSVHIQNFKSLVDVTLPVGRVNVLIGSNGSGKSNALEALVFAAAAATEKLDREFLFARGVRVTEPDLMRSAFESRPTKGPRPSAAEAFERAIQVEWEGDDESLGLHAITFPEFGNRWSATPIPDREAQPTKADLLEARRVMREQMAFLAEENAKGSGKFVDENNIENFVRMLAGISVAQRRLKTSPLAPFMIYSPEAAALRVLEPEGAVLPLGTKGEGLFNVLRELSRDTERWQELKDALGVLDWFEDVHIADDAQTFERSVRISDRFLTPGRQFDLRSANEAFLFILFYLAAVLSPMTPPIFAIDNIGASLNPKTCQALMRQLAELAKKYSKQIFLTTHNPAILDGLNLHDDEQRLFAVRRNKKGRTKISRIDAPKPLPGEKPMRLSELFMRGLLGGLPTHF